LLIYGAAAADFQRLFVLPSPIWDAATAAAGRQLIDKLHNKAGRSGPGRGGAVSVN